MSLRALPLLLAGSLLLPALPAAEPAADAPFARQPFSSWSETPPLGWNSYDAYHGAITETQFQAVVDALATRLLPSGYDTAVIDFLWYHPGPPGWDPDHDWHTWPASQQRDPATGRWAPALTLDPYGRPLPALNRFPSAAGGRGFKPLADEVHARGMKFGLHIMRGVPTEAVEANLPVHGTAYRLQDIAEPGDVSSFLRPMFTGVKPDHPGSQAYYDGLFQMFADWGVDFVKADDMLRPPYHAAEIEMMRTAIDRCGRPIVLSLSYGPTPLSRADHIVTHSNMWRVSSDFWDRWHDLRRNFELLYAWSAFSGEGTWPDGDMIPFGRLMLSGWRFNQAEELTDNHRDERDDNFTPAERQTLMSLWAIARSPLMWGGDPLTSDDATYALLTNPEILALNQHGRHPRQVLGHSPRDDTLRIWVADHPDGAGRYVALFNLRDKPAALTFQLPWEDMFGTWTVRDLWTHSDEPAVTGTLSRTLAPHASAVFLLYPSDGDKDAAALIAPGAAVTRVAEGFRFTEGPAADAAGNLYFSDLRQRTIFRYGLDGRVTPWRTDLAGCNGLWVQPDGALLCAESTSGRRLVRLTADGTTTVLADTYAGHPLNSPNDLWPDARGGIYFSDPRYGNRDNVEQDGEHVYYRRADGTLLRVADDLTRPNGVIGSRDGRTLYVADHGAGVTWAYPIRPDGSLGPRRPLADFGADGLGVDERGNVYLANGVVRIHAPDGTLLHEIPVPEHATNVSWGGPGHRTLFITAATSLYALPMRVRGY